MSLFSEFEKSIDRGFRQWTERVFGRADSDQLQLLDREILERIESMVQTAQRGRSIFPYSLVTVRFASADAERRALLEAAFARDRRLEAEVRAALTSADCELPRGFALEVEVAEEGGEPFTIEGSNAATLRRHAAAEPQPPVHVEVVRGRTSAPEYTLAEARINLGRMEEITDADQRVIRRNHVAFEEGGDEASATVSRAHASIRYDAATGEYRLLDEGSEYGTRIMREGKTIEVPAGSRRGERLRSGDEIYLGRACLRVTLPA